MVWILIMTFYNSYGGDVGYFGTYQTKAACLDAKTAICAADVAGNFSPRTGDCVAVNGAKK